MAQGGNPRGTNDESLQIGSAFEEAGRGRDQNVVFSVPTEGFEGSDFEGVEERKLAGSKSRERDNVLPEVFLEFDRYDLLSVRGNQR